MRISQERSMASIADMRISRERSMVSMADMRISRERSMVSMRPGRPEGGQMQEMPVKREVERPGSLRPAPAKTPEAPEPPEHPAKALV